MYLGYLYPHELNDVKEDMNITETVRGNYNGDKWR